MILTRPNILDYIDKGMIFIDKFDINRLGSNSYDLCLGRHLAVYDDVLLDCKKDNKVKYIPIPRDGYILEKDVFYLGVTKEYTECESTKLIPCIEGKSSIARLGIKVHFTAGFGDVGFSNHWTLEIEAKHPIRVYEGMPVAQIYWLMGSSGTVPYTSKKDAKYTRLSNKPMRSMMFKNFNQHEDGNDNR